MIKINEKLRELRHEKNVTQQNMADYLGMKLRSYQYYEQEYESGGHRPDYETLVALADYLDLLVSLRMDFDSHLVVELAFHLNLEVDL